MGAFDVELAALGYRNTQAPVSCSANDTFVGPRWRGRCVGNCNASVCRPCPSNTRLSEEELIEVYETHDEYRIDTQRYPRLSERAAREERHFIELYPGYVAYRGRQQ